MKPITALSLCFPNQNRNVAMVVLSLLAVPYWGCGGSSSSSPSTPTAVATPAPCVQSTLFQGQGEIPPSTLLSLDVAVPTAGRLDLLADWTFATNNVGLYLVQGTCTLAQFNARTCNFLGRFETTVKPKRGSVNVTPGTFTVLLANFGSQQDAGVVQVILSSATCPAVAAAAAANPASLVGNLDRSQAFRP